MMALFSLTANAQKDKLDEVELLGVWKVESADGVFSGPLPNYDNEYKRPVSFSFNDGKVSFVEWEFTDGSTNWHQYLGYWVTHSSDRVILHILPANRNNVLLHFVVASYDNGKITLQTLSGDGNLYLAQDDSSNVSAARVDSSEDGKCYNLAGVELKTPNATKGIVILDGKKVLR